MLKETETAAPQLLIPSDMTRLAPNQTTESTQPHHIMNDIEKQNPYVRMLLGAIGGIIGIYLAKIILPLLFG